MIVALALCILVHEITGGTFHRLLCDVDKLLLDELLGPVTFVETALRLRAIAEILEFRKIIYDMLAGANLTLHDVLLIEENNKAGRGKETILPNTPEEIQCLYQAILSGILAQSLIKITAGDKEEYGLYALEDLDPFVALIPLTANIIHMEDLFSTTQILGYLNAE